MESVEFRPSMGFVALSAASPVLLVALGAWGVMRGGEVRVFPAILLILGVALAGVAAFDVPYKIFVGRDGVGRRCLLRRQLFAWEDIVAFRRPQPRRGKRGVGGLGAGGDDGGAPVATGRGGLMLETAARRQYLLSLGLERPATYGAIEELVRRYAPGLSMPGPPRYARSDTPL